MNEPLNTPFECIDPAVGARIWRLEGFDLAPNLRAELEAHVSTCHACQLLIRLDRKARDLGRSGRLDARARPKPRLWRLPFERGSWLATAALAASLTAVFALPPRPADVSLAYRGADVARFLRPVEGEVLSARQPVFRWTSLAGASRYFVELRDQDGRFVWKGESATPTIRIPDQVALVRGQDYRALLTAMPADLLPPGRPSVLFRMDTFQGMLMHRARWAPLYLQVAVLLAFAWLVWPVVSGGRRAR